MDGLWPIWDRMFFQVTFSPWWKKGLFGTPSTGGYKEYQNPGQNTKKSLSSVIETFSLQNIHCTPLLREWIKGSHSPCDSQGWPDGWAQLGNFPTQQIIWDLAISAISFHIKYLIRINRGCSFVLNKASQSIYIWKGRGGAIFPWKLSQIDYGAYPAHQDMREFGTWGEISSGTAQRMGRWRVNYCQHKIYVT